MIRLTKQKQPHLKCNHYSIYIHCYSPPTLKCLHMLHVVWLHYLHVRGYPPPHPPPEEPLCVQIPWTWCSGVSFWITTWPTHPSSGSPTPMLQVRSATSSESMSSSTQRDIETGRRACRKIGRQTQVRRETRVTDRHRLQPDGQST